MTCSIRGRTARQPPRSRHRRRRRSRAELVGLDAADRRDLESVPAAGELVGVSARRVPAARGPFDRTLLTRDIERLFSASRSPRSAVLGRVGTRHPGRGTGRVPPIDRVRPPWESAVPRVSERDASAATAPPRAGRSGPGPSTCRPRLALRRLPGRNSRLPSS